MGRLTATEIKKRARAAQEAGPAPPTPVFGENTHPREKAEKMCTYLEMRIAWAREALVPERDLAALVGQYRNWTKLLGGYVGAESITAVQVVRHPDFQRALGLVREALGDNREAWAKLEAGIAALMGDA